MRTPERQRKRLIRVGLPYRLSNPGRPVGSKKTRHPHNSSDVHLSLKKQTFITALAYNSITAGGTAGKLMDEPVEAFLADVLGARGRRGAIPECLLFGTPIEAR
jgi:hypothetical protein